MKKIFFLMTLILIGCSEYVPADFSDNNNIFDKIVVIEGRAEKGALQKGAFIEAAQWSPDTGYSGKIFVSETIDDQGGYTLEGSTISGILDIKADGFFINENTGIVENDRIIITGLYDSESEYSGNINIVTHIIKQRVINLIKNGDTFSEANTQSVTEFYSNFNWTPENPLNTSISTNNKLLFLSAVICKDRTVDQVSEILTTLTADMADGIADLSILNDSILNVDCAEVENNMIEMYGMSPDIDQVKSDLIAFRNITGPAPKIYTVTPIDEADFYFFTDSKQLYKYNGNGITQITMQVTISQEGEDDIIQNFNLNDFYKIDNIIYFFANIDSETMFFSQDSGVVSTEETLPDKPIQSHVEMSNDYFMIETIVYEGTTCSDIHNLSMGSFNRNIIINNYFYGINDGISGLFFVVRDDEEIIRPSGLYFWRDDRTSIGLLQSAGSMW